VDLGKTTKKPLAMRNVRLFCALTLSCGSFMVSDQAAAAHWNGNQDPMTVGRAGHTATLMTAGPLKNKVIITGGNIGTQTLDPKHPLTFGEQTASVDLYREDGSVTALPSMYFERLYHTATALNDGRLLVVGGISTGAAATSQIYDPSSGWLRIQILHEPRGRHTATLLPDGSVLVAGGCNADTDTATATTESLNPGVPYWNVGPSMSTARCGHTATLLSNGKILVTGGVSNDNGQLNSSRFLRSTELFDPISNTWAPGPGMAAGRAWHNATCLNAECSKVLVAGGIAHRRNSTSATPVYQSAEIYDVATNRWSVAADMATPHGDGMAMARLADGRVIAMGGRFSNDSQVEIYHPAQNRWVEAEDGILPPYQPTAVRLANGNILFSGGNGDWRYHLASSPEQIVYESSPGEAR